MTIPFEKSFAFHEKSKYWSKKNLITPECVRKYSRKNTFLIVINVIMNLFYHSTRLCVKIDGANIV